MRSEGMGPGTSPGGTAAIAGITKFLPELAERGVVYRET